MVEGKYHPVLQQISDRRPELTPKGRVLAEYILKNSRKAVFMTARELSEACSVSEATVVRFVSRLGYGGYSEFLQTLRDAIDTEMTLPDRMALTDLKGPAADRFRRIVTQEMDNLRQLYEGMDMAAMARVVDLLDRHETVFVVGSRLSYTLAYYMGWSLVKVRENLHILKGSDTIALDRLTVAPAEALVVVIATSRYPNELIRICRHVRRLELTLAVLTDSLSSPLIPFAQEHLIAPSRYIPYLGCPTSLSCLINFIVQELAGRRAERVKAHQERIEQTYRENDIFFNLDKG